MYVEEEAPAAVEDRPICGLPVDTRHLFSDKDGVPREDIRVGRMKLLQKVGFLAPFLHEGEVVVFVTTGQSPYTLLDWFTTGRFWLPKITCALFVFTDRRIFHVCTTPKYECRGSIAQILYADCRQLCVKGTTLIAEYQTGRVERFHNIPRGDGQIIQRINIETGDVAAPSERPERNHLCPKCTSVLAPDSPACSSCGLEFKTKAQAYKWSLLVPGGGYFYTNHKWIGVADAVAESLIIVLLVTALIGTLLGDPESPPYLVYSGVLLIVEKMVTIYHARRFLGEFIPKHASAPPVASPAQGPLPSSPTSRAPLGPTERVPIDSVLRGAAMTPIPRPQPQAIRRSKKKPFWIVGGVVAAVLGLFIFGGGRLFCKLAGLDRESRAYVNEVVPAVCADLSAETLRRYACEEFRVALSMEPIDAIYDHIRRMYGEFEGVNGATGGAMVKYTLGRGMTVSALYRIDAQFETGPVEIEVALVKRGGRWQFKTINFHRGALSG